MRIGIIKPDFQIVGGFERVLEHVRTELERAGHRVNSVPIDVRSLSTHPYGVRIPEKAWIKAEYYFRYLGLVEQFSALDLADFDMVLSTQPPSFAASHPRHLSLFFHHERMFYDLAEAYVEAGYAPATLHPDAVRRVQEVDAPRLRAVRHFLAGGDEVRSRLERFNNLTANVGDFLAGVDVTDAAAHAESMPSGPVLCVSRHEFPKRTELFIHAMKLAGDAKGVMVGGGGRLEYVRRLDAWLSAKESDEQNVSDRELWLNRGEPGAVPEPRRRQPSNVEICGHVSDEHLATLYQNALCLVAPALLEDYGLTALEAMAYGKPVIVCEDGGHLSNLVHDGVTGLVVPPTARGIADAVQRLRDDPRLLRELGLQARALAREFTWKRAGLQLLAGVDAVMS